MRSHRDGDFQSHVERLESERQEKAARVVSHPLFSSQSEQEEDRESEPEAGSHPQVIMDAVLKALSTHYAQQAVAHARKGSSLDRVLSAARKRAEAKSSSKSRG